MLKAAQMSSATLRVALMLSTIEDPSKHVQQGRRHILSRSSIGLFRLGPLLQISQLREHSVSVPLLSYSDG